MQFFSDILGSFHGPTKTMLHQARTYQTLEERIQHLLAIDVRVARLSDKELVLQVSDAALATRIQYRSSQFLDRLHQDGLVLGIRRIIVNVRPPARVTPKTSRQPLKISKENQALLVAHANALEPSALREALLNLSERSE